MTDVVIMSIVEMVEVMVVVSEDGRLGGCVYSGDVR